MTNGLVTRGTVELTIHESLCGTRLCNVYDALRKKVIRVDGVQRSREFDGHLVLEVVVVIG